MFNTNSEYLRPELMDIIRAFDCEDENITHYYSYGDGKVFNSIEYGGEFYDSEDELKTDDELEFKRLVKRYSKLALYIAIAKHKGKLPWGALTGIRPTKLAYGELAQGKDFRQLFSLMDVNGQNISLVADILETQKDIYAQRGGQDVFISIPFCPTKCDYCSFITAPITATKKYVESYIDCLVREIKALKNCVKKLNSVYIGGGTPFVLSTGELERIYSAVKETFPHIPEYTVEAGRPDVFEREKLQLSKDFGVTRICVNPQTFNDDTLIKIGRRHSAYMAERVYTLAKEYGFIINMDLIAGLADEKPSDFEKSLNRALWLDPENITVHTLSLKSGAKLKERTKRLDIEGISDMVKLSRKLLSGNGYRPYYMYRQKYQAGGLENVGWSKEGCECVYNVNVMEEISDNPAVGANAISKKLYGEENRIERFATPKDIPTYIAKIDKIIEERNKLFG